MHIRAGDHRDLDQVDRLDRSRGGASSRSIREVLSPAPRRLIVATVGRNVVGYAVVGAFFEYDFLELLFVAPDERRGGIGSRLVAAAVDAASSDRLFTSTNRSNAAMQRLCDKLGFVRCGVVDGLDRGDPELFYVRRL